MRLFRDSQVAQRRCSGMTLVEIMVTSLIAAVVLAMVATLIVFATRSVLAMTNYTELDQDSRNALDLLTRDIRQAATLDFYSTNQIRLTTPNGPDKTTFIYTYNKAKGCLYRQAGTFKPEVLLTNCDYLTFKISQRNPSNDFTFYSASNNTAVAKLIDVSWKCSREIKAQKVNTESIQTAKIVMRN